jgi:hypothetical protein
MMDTMQIGGIERREKRRQQIVRPSRRKSKLEREQAKKKRRAQAERDRASVPDNDHCVMSFAQWCAINGFSLATGRRIISAGNGPVLTQLSERRVGVIVANNRTWQASRARGATAA